MELKPKEMADAAHDRPFAGTHVVQRPDGAVAAENPEDVEPAQRVNRRNSPRRRNGHDLDETLRRQLQLHVRGSFEGQSKRVAPAPRIIAARLAPDLITQMMPDKFRLCVDLHQPRAASAPSRGDLGAAGFATAGAPPPAAIISAA